uniref:Calcineurin-like phosphoesterase n=1 Tax=viral metagenome TaxID=1070528 RepID=A0A6M3JM15_9ZZZZ
MKRFVTSDFHLGHANILKYCGRTLFMTKEDLDKYNSLQKGSSEREQKSFIISQKSLENMNEGIIKNHNSRVKPDDEVYFIGDFCFKNSKGGKPGEGTTNKAKEYLSRLNGRFIFIRGNHDKNNSLNIITERLVINYANKRINLVHRPDFVDMNYDINLVGHVHQLWKFKRIRRGEQFTDAINVGVDVNNFRPVLLEEILAEYSKWKKTQI